MDRWNLVVETEEMDLRRLPLSNPLFRMVVKGLKEEMEDKEMTRNMMCLGITGC